MPGTLQNYSILFGGDIETMAGEKRLNKRGGGSSNLSQLSIFPK